MEIAIADLAQPTDASDLVRLLNIYAIDPMGGGRELSNDVKHHLAATLAQRSDVTTIFAKVDGAAVGMLICFEGFSTFSCQPLLNIHDAIVVPAYRGRGILKLMLSKAEEIARAQGCCKLTLEVLAGNQPARAGYTKFGFEGYQLDPQMGDALFLHKRLT